MEILSWNVNGLRAAIKKGFIDWLEQRSPDIICLQETRVLPEQVKNIPSDYHQYWNPAEKKGYSGVATLTKKEPLSISKDLGIEEFDTEGRFLQTEFQDFYLINLYFPNAQRGLIRIDYKLEFNSKLLEHVEKLRSKTTKLIVICGDLNAAHKEIDLKNPKQNVNNAGFSPKERAFITEMIDHGYIDTFREFNKSPGNYTWWTYRYNARVKNIGWRIDYFIINIECRDRLKSAFILKNVMGSDHAPVGVEIEVKY
ncbi:MAG: exodeoxyribonuclease III [Candidatus Hodarchaeales archaeon]